jgi:hypothetical protein
MEKLNEEITSWANPERPIYASDRTGGWLQWKGTDACIDLTCKACGHDDHVDDEFLYFWRCPKCQIWWRLEPEITLTQVTGDHDFTTPGPFGNLV